jgi:MFS family permease
MLPAKTSTEASGFKALLKNRAFLLLWGGQIFSQIADKVLTIMCVGLLTSYHIPVRFAAASASYVFIASTIPAILFGAAAGIYVNRHRKKQIMVASNLVRGLLTLLLPILPKEFVILLIIIFAIYMVTQAFTPAEQSAIPLVVKPQNLLPANALFTTTQIGSVIVGFAIGEPLLTAVTSISKNGAQEVLVSSLYLVAAGLVQLIKIEETIDRSQRARRLSPWHDLKDGFKYLQSNKLLLNAILQLSVFSATIAALPILAINLTAEVGLEPKQFGFLVAAAGIGLVLGAGILGHFGNRLPQKSLPLIGFIGMSVVLAVFTFVHNIWMGLLCGACLGLGASLVNVPMQTLIQERTPESMRGKVFGFQNNVVNIALSVPLIITAPLTDRFGLQPVLWGMSLIVTVAGVLTWRATCQVMEETG